VGDRFGRAAKAKPATAKKPSDTKKAPAKAEKVKA